MFSHCLICAVFQQPSQLIPYTNLAIDVYIHAYTPLRSEPTMRCILLVMSEKMVSSVSPILSHSTEWEDSHEQG